MRQNAFSFSNAGFQSIGQRYRRKQFFPHATPLISKAQTWVHFDESQSTGDRGGKSSGDGGVLEATIWRQKRRQLIRPFQLFDPLPRFQKD